MRYSWDPRHGFRKKTSRENNREIGDKVYGQPLDSGYAWIVLIASLIIGTITINSRYAIPYLYEQEHNNSNSTSISSDVIIDNSAFKYFGLSFIVSGI